MIPFFRQEFNEEMKQAALSALESEKFVLGESVLRFEEAFAEYLGVKEAVAVSSGTAALKIALLSLGIKPKQKVLVPAWSFIASATSVIHAGSKPLLVDVSEETALIEPASLKSADRLAAVMPVHLYGQSCKMNELLDFCKDNKLLLVEDACQAHGAEFNGKKAGSFGDAGCFSFYPTKNMNVGGDGGMIATNNEEMAEKARSYRDCGRVSTDSHGLIGFTERLNTVNAAIGLVQLKYLDKWVEKRQKIAFIYQKNLPQNAFFSQIKGSTHSYNVFAIKATEREKLLRVLEAEGIGYAVHYAKPIHLQPAFMDALGFKGGEFPASENLAKLVVSLPIYPSLKIEDAEKVCEAVNSVLK